MLHDPELHIPRRWRRVIAATESWIMRRLMLRLPGADLGRVVADLILTNRSTPPEQLGQRVRNYLTNLTESGCGAGPSRLPVRAGRLAERRESTKWTVPGLLTTWVPYCIPYL